MIIKKVRKIDNKIIKLLNDKNKAYNHHSQYNKIIKKIIAGTINSNGYYNQFKT